MKIAVHCKTKEEWDKVQQKLFGEGRKWNGHNFNERIRFSNSNCIYLEDINLMQGSLDYSNSEGYTIISAQEYLKGADTTSDEATIIINNIKGEDKKTVDFDDIQEDVCTMCREYYDMSPSYLCEGVKCDEATDMYLEDNNLTLKEDNKGEDTMNISDNIFEVFDKADMKKVQERFGDQYSPNSDRDLLALKRDKKDLLAIIKKEEEALEKD